MLKTSQINNYTSYLFELGPSFQIVNLVDHLVHLLDYFI